MFTFISTSMTGTTIRFLNYEMGKKDGKINKVFNQSNVLHILLAITILLLLESIGVFYILNYLRVDAGKEFDAMFVFQVSTVVACMGIISVPYRGIFVACEKFKTIALIEIANVLLKLFLVIALLYYQGNALRFYAVSMSTMTFVSFICYYWGAKRNWPDIIKWNFVRDWRAYKEQFFFSNWNLLNSSSMVARNQGGAVLINLFFGTVVNAAYAISYTVMRHIIDFVGRFDTAVTPQIIKNLGANQSGRSLYLASHTCRICILLTEIVFFALSVELDFILQLWLGENLPHDTALFCQYTLLISLVSSTSCGLVPLINGTGKIKWFMIQKSIWYMAALLAGFFILKYTKIPYIIIILFVLSDVFNRCSQFLLLKKILSFKVWEFIRDAYSRPLVIFVVMSVFVHFYHNLHWSGAYFHIMGIILTLCLNAVLIFLIGLNKGEKNRIIGMLNKK